MKYLAFTCKSDRILRQLRTEVYIEDDSIMTPIEDHKFIAIWDTGATSTCITKRLAGKLGIKPTGVCDNHTAGGHREAAVFLVNVLLPNHVLVPNVQVHDMEDNDDNFDVLIGMDIISLGDFCISNYDKKTVFTFRLPSKKLTDYVIQENFEKTMGPKHGKGKKSKRHK